MNAGASTHSSSPVVALPSLRRERDERLAVRVARVLRRGTPAAARSRARPPRAAAGTAQARASAAASSSRACALGLRRRMSVDAGARRRRRQAPDLRWRRRSLRRRRLRRRGSCRRGMHHLNATGAITKNVSTSERPVTTSPTAHPARRSRCATSDSTTDSFTKLVSVSTTSGTIATSASSATLFMRAAPRWRLAAACPSRARARADRPLVARRCRPRLCAAAPTRPHELAKSPAARRDARPHLRCRRARTGPTAPSRSCRRAASCPRPRRRTG